VSSCLGVNQSSLCKCFDFLKHIRSSNTAILTVACVVVQSSYYWEGGQILSSTRPLLQAPTLTLWWPVCGWCVYSIIPPPPLQMIMHIPKVLTLVGPVYVKVDLAVFDAELRNKFHVEDF
jgi:hypothetical protein